LPISMKCPYCDHIYDDYAAYKDHENDCWILVFLLFFKINDPEEICKIFVIFLIKKGGGEYV
jgi:uncharacterized C2H2 Zn-finger protein